MDVWQIQRINQQAEVLFDKDHVLEPNFAAPMPVPDVYEHHDEEELLGVEYASPPASLLGTTMCRKVQYVITHLHSIRTREARLSLVIHLFSCIF